jgi:hypothetical protein
MMLHSAQEDWLPCTGTSREDAKTGAVWCIRQFGGDGLSGVTADWVSSSPILSEHSGRLNPQNPMRRNRSAFPNFSPSFRIPARKEVPMPITIALSESAVALLRYRVKKWPIKVTERQ